MKESLQVATIRIRAREADNALQLLAGMLRDFGADMDAAPFSLLIRAQLVAQTISDGGIVRDPR